MEAVRAQVQLCQEVESELRELCQECRKKFPIIKEYTERAILKIRHHREDAESNGRGSGSLSDFPLDEVLRAILMACETFQHKIVMVSLTCLQRLIHRQVLKDETIAIVINLMKEQATNGDEIVQLKVLQTIMATPSHMTLLNELVVEQLMQLLYVLHNSANASVHHTACAGLRQLAEHLADQAAATASQVTPGSEPVDLDGIRPVVRSSASAGLPSVTPAQAPETLTGPLRMFYVFVQDLCVMADYDVSSMSSRYAMDPNERMRTGNREGFWLAAIKFPRPLCLELLAACVAVHSIFTLVPECFALLRHHVCAALLKNIRGCFDFAILIRSVHLLQQVFKCPALAAAMIPELQVFLRLMLDLTNAERSPWQRATSMEFLRSICEDPQALAVLYESSLQAQGANANAAGTTEQPLFLELVNSLSKLIHQVCFSAGLDSGALLQSAGGSGGNAASSSSQRAAGHDVGRGSVGASLLDRAGFLSHASLPNFGGGAGGLSSSAPSALGSASSSGDIQSSSSAQSVRAPPRVKLLSLMNETEPPAIQPALLVSLVVDSVFSIVSTMYRLLLDIDEGATAEQEASSAAAPPESPLVRASSTPDGPFPGGRVTPLGTQLTPSQERCRGMLSDCWASLLSALSLLLHGTSDETGLQQALRCLQTLLYCCGRLSLDQARDACLLQFARYTVPGPGREGENEQGIAGGHGFSAATTSSATSSAPTAKNVLCFKALLHFCYRFGGLLGEPGWTIALKAFQCLERNLQKAPPAPGTDLTVLRQALDSLFETTSLLPDAGLLDVVGALGRNLRSTSDAEEGAVILNRMVELCNFNLARLFLVWDRILTTITEVCTTSDDKLRGLAASALCRILAQALRKGALAMAEQPEAAQDELLRHLEVLLRSRHDDTRARICEGLLTILQASGQELHPTAWGTMIHLVSTAARVELERVGLGFYLPGDLSLLKQGSNGQADRRQGSMDVSGEEALPPIQSSAATAGGVPEGRDASSSAALPTVFQLLELLVHDFMEYVPLESVPRLTVSIGAFARFTGLGVNSSLTAVGFLWNVADALARYHCAGTDAAEKSVEVQAPSSRFEELWVHIFMQLRAMASDTRPEVRNCAVKSLSTALLSHGRKVGVACYRRCLSDILIEVIAEIQAAGRKARAGHGSSGSKGEGLIVHHSRDTPEKQWDETLVLAMEGVRRVLSHFSEEAGVSAFAPLAYTMLLQVQDTICTLTAETAGSALRALVDIMRIPASSQAFKVEDAFVSDPRLPLPEGTRTTSVWILGWSVLWRMVGFCLAKDVPESLVETFASTLNALRSSHRHLFTSAQHLILLQLSMLLVTLPSFYLPSSSPLQAEDDKEASPNGKEHSLSTDWLAEASQTCAQADVQAQHPGHGREEQEVFQFVEASPRTLWSHERRSAGKNLQPYAKAPVAVTSLVGANQSKNCETWSTEAALKAVLAEGSAEDTVQSFLGPSRSPTHRTMLHISSARLQHVQGFAFGLLEETQCFSDASLEALFLCQLCAMFLDGQRILVDTNKLALAARSLCLVIVFCRRVLLERCLKMSSGEAESAARHLEVFLGSTLPKLLQVITELACCRGRPKLRESGIWKLALEALAYMVEDSLAAAERCSLSGTAASCYWDALTTSLSKVVSGALSHGGPHPSQESTADTSLLAQVLGNLLTQRLLSCSKTPTAVAEKAVHLLQDLVGRQAGGSANLRHLFTLCAAHSQASLPRDSTPEDEEQKLSVAAKSARGTAMPARAAHIPYRERLLGIAAPALLGHVRSMFSDYVQEEEARQRGAPVAESVSQKAAEVRSVLSYLNQLRIDEAVTRAALPSSSDRARAACSLASSRGLVMAFLPQLAALTSTGDPEVRKMVREVLEGLASELEL
eukprot:TRINITY_DN33425_c0_g2_i1.p1 TRINITY_DN33425_c0_g2~~TRINITY_DN33425_c0_g2_i1.p1  ORF type:complete len:1879 (-),score=400.44 TRINITY_DN33425_c0_g2_i1:16-5652(-)